MSPETERETRAATVSELPLDDLLAETLQRVRGAVDERQRLQMLLDTVISLAANLSLDGVLNHIVRAACGLLDARYAALGVLGPDPGQRLRLLVHHGLSAEQLAALGGQPRGLGVLGALIRDPAPLRIRDLTQHPQYRGLPPGMPEMRSFLGVPILIHGEVYGNLYVTQKSTGPEFTEADEKTAVALAAAAGVAIENARLYTQSAQRERWHDTTAEVTSRLAQSESLQAGADLVVERVHDSAAADVAWLVAVDTDPEGAGHRVREVARASADPALTLRRPDLVTEVAAEGGARSVDDLVGHTTDAEHGPGYLLPITVVGQSPGVLALGWAGGRQTEHAELDLASLAHFADRASLALQALQSRHDHERIALLEDRDRIAQDLHDVVIQRLFAIGLSLRSTQGSIGHDDAARRVDQATADLDDTIREIRRTIFSLRVPDTARDVQSAALQLVEQAGRMLKFRPRIEFSGPVRSVLTGTLADDVIAVLAESLSNAARHASPTSIEIELALDGDEVRLQVADDGVGLPADVVESGLANVRARALRHGGSCEVSSAPERGTRIVWSVPLPMA